MPLAVKLFLRRFTQVHRARAGGDDQCVAAVFAAVADQALRGFVEEHAVNVIEDDFSLEALGVLLHALHQYRAGQAFHVPGPVIDIGGGHQLASGFDTGDDHRFQIGARGVHSG